MDIQEKDHLHIGFQVCLHCFCFATKRTNARTCFCLLHKTLYTANLKNDLSGFRVLFMQKISNQMYFFYNNAHLQNLHIVAENLVVFNTYYYSHLRYTAFWPNKNLSVKNSVTSVFRPRRRW